MFTRARLHLTLLYAGLLGVTVILLAGAIGVLAVREARNTDDRELQIRASALASSIPSGPPPSATGPNLGGQGGQGPDDRGRGPDDHGPPHLEQQGVLEFIMPVAGGQITPPPPSGITGLPDMTGAQLVLQTGTAHYRTVSVSGTSVRDYSLPVFRNSGQLVGIVQVARSRYFVNAAISRLAIISLVSGLIGLAVSAAAGYWLAGRTLRPIATALERQRDFAADASHELRTPLTVMLTNAELLTLHPERPLSAYQDVVEDIVAEIQRLSRLVNDLLTLARADQGKTALSMDAVNLTEIATAVARQFEPLATSKGLALKTDVHPEVIVWGDQDRLHQLCVILIDNAVRYTSSGSVTVRVAPEGQDGLLAVSDTGPGIAAEHVPHIFERFYRTDEARSSEEGGSGLGLALAQWIVDSHHGRIEVTSTPGQGSAFSVHLPGVPTHGRRRPS